MRPLLLLFSVLLFETSIAQSFTTPFERSNGNQSATYFEVIDFYRQLDRNFPTIDLQKAGPTDMIYPLHVVFYCKDKNFDIKDWHQQNKLVILINNGIHPGEPDGIDASMMLLRDAATGKISVPENIVLAVIPVFNIGGALNRGSYSRVNQNGPEKYGFRGSAENLDLNRDFIKMDAKETQTLVHLFHSLDPDIFIDNHVSNGADYQHVVTLLSENPAKQGYYMGKYLKDTLEPALYAGMKTRDYDLVPYVNHWGHTPDKGWPQFYDPPRFTSGFAALFQTFAFVPETHMLKPYHQRVAATYALMQTFISYASGHAAEIQKVRKNERTFIQEQNVAPLDWRADSVRYSEITFKGYEGKYKASKVSGAQRLYYDRNAPYTKTIPFYNKFLVTKATITPNAYVIPQGWHRAIERLKMNDVKMQRLNNDSSLNVTVYRITSYETTPKPYEGHYLHSKVQFNKGKEKIHLLKGDYIIPVQQTAKRYLMETLEPDAPDAFFAWGFFDAILQQKEYFSDYVFEDLAADLLQQQPELRKQLKEKKKTDKAFAKDGEAQLDFVYRHSAYMEPEYMRYPVFRIEAD